VPKRGGDGGNAETPSFTSRAEAPETAAAITEQFRGQFEGVIGSTLPQDVEFIITQPARRRPDLPGAGWVEGAYPGRVYLSWPALRWRPEDIGIVLHELGHVATLQSGLASYGPASSWVHEGLADYLKFRLLDEMPPQPQPGRPIRRGYIADPISGGYVAGARFFFWMEQTFPGSVRDFASQITAGRTSDVAAYWATGSGIDELRKRYYDESKTWPN